MSSWDSFQADVLDVFRQYSGYLDFFEQVGATGRNSRPDCLARITRKDKKEVWIVDVKHKGSLDSGDVQRMEKYREMISANPIDVGLDFPEFQEHEMKSFFVTSEKVEHNDYRCVSFPELHQFLQRELVYSETDRVVRDISRMAQNRNLKQQQARLLYRGLKPYIRNVRSGMELLRELETKYAGMNLEEPGEGSIDGKISVDAVLKHEPRGKNFLVDIPYGENGSREEKLDSIRESVGSSDEEFYYAALSSDGKAGEKLYSLEELESEIKRTASVVSPEEVADWFKPRSSLKKTVEDGGLAYEGEGFSLEVSSSDDISHTVRAKLPKKAASNLADTIANSGSELGNLNSNVFTLQIEITEDYKVRYNETVQPVESFMKTARTVFRSSVSPAVASNASERT